MDFLRKRRNELGLTQEQLAQMCRMTRHRISEIENGYSLPSKNVAERLEKVLKLDAIPNTSLILGGRQVRRLVRPQSYHLSVVRQEPWNRLKTVWGYILRKIAAPAHVVHWMSRFMHCDSAAEALALVLLAAAGAVPRLANPHAFGYLAQPVFDSQGFILGAGLLPALHWATNEFECVLWPQTSIRPGETTYRVDFLIMVCWKGRYLWMLCEIDGPYHNAELDAERTRQLGLPVIRIKTEEVKKLRFIQLLTAGIREKVCLQLAAA